MEFGETLEEACLREVREEVGLKSQCFGNGLAHFS